MQNEKMEREPYVYQKLLAEYERVMEDESYSEESWSNDIYDYVKRYIGKTQLYYCIKDLAGDGKPELIIGTLCDEEEYEIRGVTYGGMYIPFIIYTYEENRVYISCIKENYIMEIYENGVIELISGGAWQHFMYEQIEKNAVCKKSLDTIVWVMAESGENFYKEENGKYINITEEEFCRVRNQYTAVKEKLEWKPISGFWNIESTE